MESKKRKKNEASTESKALAPPKHQDAAEATTGGSTNKRHDPATPPRKRPARRSASRSRKANNPQETPTDSGNKAGDAGTKELHRDLIRIATLMDSEKSAGLQVGAIASKWIGSSRYSRVLNASTFAKEFAAITNRQLKASVVSRYVDAYEVSELLRRAEVETGHLKVSHYEQLAQCRCESDDELVELARRANDQQVSVKKIKTLAASLHAEIYRDRRTVELVTTESRVKCMDALDLLAEQADGSIECLVTDWQWCK